MGIGHHARRQSTASQRVAEGCGARGMAGSHDAMQDTQAGPLTAQRRASGLGHDMDFGPRASGHRGVHRRMAHKSVSIPGVLIPCVLICSCS